MLPVAPKMIQETEKKRILSYGFVVNLFRITEAKHYNSGLYFVENIISNNLMCSINYYLASILNLTEKRRFVYLDLVHVQCRHTPGQV